MPLVEATCLYQFTHNLHYPAIPIRCVNFFAFALSALCRLDYNVCMSEKPIDRLESQLETLIEGAFARLFRRTLNARDIAVLIARSMEDNLEEPTGDDPRYIAPDVYRLFLHPDTVKHFLKTYPDMSTRLSHLIVDLGTQSGYRLNSTPIVKLLASDKLGKHQFNVVAEHGAESRMSTAAMQPMEMPKTETDVYHPQLVIGDDRIIDLTKSLINIGRDEANDIVILDAYISRHHLQLRKRFGAYTLFDVNSRGGTKVNNTRIREHRLQNGDVIHIGRTKIIYTDETGNHSSTGQTQTLDPL